MVQSRESGAAAVLLVSAIGATIAVAVSITAFSHDYDEGVYWQSLLSLDAGHHLYSSVFSSQPPLFLVGLLPFFHLFGPSVVAGRAPLVVLAIFGLVAIWQLGRRAGTSSGLLAPALVLSVAPFVLSVDRIGATTPSVALGVIGVAVAEAASRRSGGVRLGLAAVAGLVIAGSTMVKLLGAVAGVPALLFVLVPPSLRPEGESVDLASRSSGGWQSRVPSALSLLAGSVVGLLAIGAAFWSHGDLYDQVVRFHMQARGLRAGPLFNLKTIAFATITTPLYLASVVVVVIVAWRRIAAAAIYVAWLAVGAVFLLVQHPLFAEHRLILVPPAALIVAGLPAWLAEKRTTESVVRMVRVAVSAVIVVGVIGVVYVATTTDRSIGRDDAAMIDGLRAKVPATTVVVTDDPVVAAAAGRRLPPALVDTSNVRFEARNLDAADLIRVTENEAGAVLLTGGRFDQVPAFATWVEQNMTLAATFANGATLYVKK